MMWRANVIARVSDGRVIITIPDLFGEDPIGPVQSCVDALEGEKVVVADLKPGTRVHDWWVVDYESRIGRWGDPYPHTHPIGQVDGLTAALDAKADDTDLANYALKTDLDAYATTTALNDGLAKKADVAGAWADCTVSSYLALDTTTSPTLAVRATPFGVQLRGRYRLTSDVARDVVMFTMPTGFAPSYPVLINAATMGPGTAYEALKYQFEIRTTGEVTSREAFLSNARVVFNETLFY